MRFVVDLSTEIARSVIGIVENGQFASADEVVERALKDFIGASEQRNAITSDRARPLTGAPAQGSLTGSVVANVNPKAPWIWGMVNRVFPLKVALRVCANLCVERPIALPILQRRASEAALNVGEQLTVDDQMHARKRNELRAIALPRGEEIEKSKLRFASQFVGRETGQKTYIGGLFETGLAGPVGDLGLVAPTAMGWEFASLRNPVLDDPPGMTNLSDDECDFYLTKTARDIPGERHAFITILKPLAAESLSPEALIRNTVPRVADSTSPVVGDTARAGAIGRLIDLRAIHRIPLGRSATLRITDRGRTALRVLADHA